MRLFIEPVEPLLFRTGRPFNAGESNFAESLFPPTPETLQGAIRATIATYLMPDATPAQAFSNDKIRDLIGYYSYYGRFRITSISLGRYQKDTSQKHIRRLFPAPVCILQEEDEAKSRTGLPQRQMRLLPRAKEPHIQTNLPETMQLLYCDMQDTKGKLEPLKGWMTEQSLHHFLEKGEDISQEDIVSNNTIYISESRLGIGIDNASKATQEGLLYQVQMIRMNHDHKAKYRYGFVVDVSLAPQDDRDTKDPQRYLNTGQTRDALKLGAIRFPDEGWMTLGGERRAARFEIVEHTESTEDSVENLKSGKMLYLATPASLTRGWQPERWSDVGMTAPPIAVTIDRYQPIGGWQLEPSNSGGQNKTMRRCVPAGTVYYFRELVHITQPLTDYGTKIGYGIAYAGEYKR